jgi:hypothetical protein
VEPVKKECEEVRRLGQDLIQSAAAGVSTSELEFDIQTLNNAWSGLNDRVSLVLSYAVTKGSFFQVLIADFVTRCFKLLCYEFVN